MKSIVVFFLTFSIIPYVMASPQRNPDPGVDTARPHNTLTEDLLSLKCDESNILSCIIAEVDQVEDGLIRVVMADHNQIFLPCPPDDCCDCLQEVIDRKNEPLLQKVNDEVNTLNFQVRPDDHGNYIDLLASFDKEIHGQIELRSDRDEVIMTIPFYHTVILDERIDVSKLKKGKYGLVLRIGSDTWERQLSI